GGDMTFELARATGPTGRALGIDLDPTQIELARREAQQLSLANITFEVRDVTTWQPCDAFDLVYARFLLSHLTHPESLVAALHEHIRPAGVFIVEDIDFRGHFAEPPCPALSRYVELYTTSVQTRGGDANIGPRLPAMLREAGFEEVGMRLAHPASLEGGIKLLSCMTLEKIAEAVLEDGVTTKEELNETIRALYDFADDPETVLGGPRVFQVWGRKGE
ncbi:MAG TPA: methyltransferase domain-containing protein, partial [Rhodothermales bacterium]|nr:methyltransferase domain-containing protein [Rhodothermales bacterium]